MRDGDAAESAARAVVGLIAMLVIVSPAIYIVVAAPVWAASGIAPAVEDALLGVSRLPAHLADPASAFPRSMAQAMPTAATWWLSAAATVVAGLLILIEVAIQIDRQRGRRRMALRRYDPRRRLTPRSFARPRDLAHLRTGAADSWTTIRLDRRIIGTGPGTHVLCVAPTGSGKTTGPVRTWLLEHDGPAIVTSTKTDVLDLTYEARRRLGPVWIYAPLVPTDALPTSPCGWTPLAGCADWERALFMGRWLTSGSGDHGESDGARFYNHEAARLLAPVLHAAALSGRDMSQVNRWLRAEAREPVDVLIAHDAAAAAAQLEAVWRLDPRPRSLTVMSAGQLVDAYEFPGVIATDHDDFSPDSLLRDGGTLYLIAPESPLCQARVRRFSLENY